MIVVKARVHPALISYRLVLADINAGACAVLSWLQWSCMLEVIGKFWVLKEATGRNGSL